MNRLDRYIAVHVLGLSGITALALLAIQTFIAFVSEIDEIGPGFGFLQLAQFIALQVPTALLTLLPIVAMLGTLLGLGVLASSGELVAMRAAGISVLRLGGATLGAGLVLVLIAVLLGDFVAPAGQQAAEQLRARAKYGVDPGAANHPVWLRAGNQVVFVRSLIAEDHIRDVTIYTLDDNLGIDAVTHADDGRYLAGGWALQDVRRTRFADEGAQAEVMARLDWQGELSPTVLRLFVLEADSLSTTGLMRLVSYLDRNGLDTKRYRVSLWRKLVNPITVIAMMLLAVPFVLGPLRDTGAGQRLLVGILIGLGFWVINEMGANAGQLYQWPAALSAAAPTVLITMIALWRMARFR